MAESDNAPLPKFGAAHRRAIRRYLWTVVAPILAVLIVANGGVWVWIFGEVKDEAISRAVAAAKEEMNREKNYVDFYRDRAQESERIAHQAATDARVSAARFQDLNAKIPELVQRAEAAERDVKRASDAARNVTALIATAERVEQDKLTIAKALSDDPNFVAKVIDAATKFLQRPNCEKHRIFFTDQRGHPLVPNGVIVARDDAMNPPPPLTYVVAPGPGSTTYTVTVPLVADFNDKYEVAVGFGEFAGDAGSIQPANQVPPSRHHVRVVAKRAKDFDVEVTIWNGSFHQFQVECLVVRQ